jgi:hypothetical protein
VKLYEISEAHQRVMSRIADADGELDETLESELDSIQAELTDKVHQTAAMVRTLEAEAKAVADEAKRLQERSRALRAHAERVKAYAGRCLKDANVDRVKTPLFTVAWQDSPPAVHVEDDSEIPMHYWRNQDPKLDKRAISEDLKAGKHVPGCKLVTGQTLRLR